MSVNVRTSWPWITLLLIAVAALNPVGLNFLRSAFLASEQLSRNIARPIVVMIGGGLAVLCLLEFGIRKFLISRKAGWLVER
jgi:hypothetical protein